MVFVKVVKDRSYFKRFQTKFRRRREGKTDYRARQRLIFQYKNKYNASKYRFIVRITNKDVICQVARAERAGDLILSAACSHELPRYGITLGLTNYAAAYATGLLLARRVLKKLKLDTSYQGETQVNGKDFIVEENDEGPRPFCCLLDVGLARTTTGSRVFAAMKGMCDGGVNIPHSEKRFVGYSKDSQKLDSEVLRKYLHGGHVADYMNYLEEEDPEKYRTQFSRYIKAEIKADDLEEIYANAHKKIRDNPDLVKKTSETKPVKRKRQQKLSRQQRAQRVRQKKQRLENEAAESSS